MPWTSSKEGTLPSLKNKSLESREIFARVANAATLKRYNITISYTTTPQ